jgi:hypothetical protein
VIERAERHVLRPGQSQRRVDLVDQQDDSVAQAEVGHRDQLLPRPNPAGRVVRVAQQVRADAVAGQRPVERLGIQVVTAVASPAERRLDDPAAREAQPVEERRVHRRVDHDPCPWRRGRLHELGDAGHHVGDREDQGRIRRPAQPIGREARERLAKLALVPVTAVSGGDRCRRGRHDRLGQVEVHLGHEGGEHVRRISPPLQAGPLPQLIKGATSEARVHSWIVTRPGRAIRSCSSGGGPSRAPGSARPRPRTGPAGP